jgi:DnaJ-class molecular chaperone
MSERCYYEVLGLQRTVNDDELKSAIRKPALKWHPDRNRGEGTQSGLRFRLKGKGMPVLRSRQTGDMYVEVFVETPLALRGLPRKFADPATLPIRCNRALQSADYEWGQRPNRLAGQHRKSRRSALYRPPKAGNTEPSSSTLVKRHLSLGERFR